MFKHTLSLITMNCGLIFSDLLILTFCYTSIKGNPGTQITKYHLVLGIPSGHFHRTYTRKVQCGNLCSLEENCNFFGYKSITKECRLYPPQFLAPVVSARDYQVYSTDKALHELLTEPLPWETAKEVCESKGGHLAFIKTEEKQKEIEYLLLHNSLSLTDCVWIGGDDITDEGTFHWLDGMAVSSGFENWAGGQPDDSLLREDCMVLLMDDRWNDAECTAHYSSICEYE